MKEYQLLRGLGDGATTHPSRHPRANDANPILIRTEMGRIHRVTVLSDASFAPFDPLRHPPQSVSVHSRNDSGDTGGRSQGPVMDRLVAELGGSGGTHCSALRVGPQPPGKFRIFLPPSDRARVV